MGDPVAPCLAPSKNGVRGCAGDGTSLMGPARGTGSGETALRRAAAAHRVARRAGPTPLPAWRRGASPTTSATPSPSSSCGRAAEGPPHEDLQRAPARASIRTDRDKQRERPISRASRAWSRHSTDLGLRTGSRGWHGPGGSRIAKGHPRLRLRGRPSGRRPRPASRRALRSRLRARLPGRRRGRRDGHDRQPAGGRRSASPGRSRERVLPEPGDRTAHRPPLRLPPPRGDARRARDPGEGPLRRPGASLRRPISSASRRSRAARRSSPGTPRTSRFSRHASRNAAVREDSQTTGSAPLPATSASAVAGGSRLSPRPSARSRSAGTNWRHSGPTRTVSPVLDLAEPCLDQRSPAQRRCRCGGPGPRRRPPSARRRRRRATARAVSDVASGSDDSLTGRV